MGMEEYQTRLEGLKGSLKSLGNAARVTNKTASFVSEFLQMAGQEG